MKVEFHIKEIVITAKQKSLIEKKILKLKRYIKDEPLVVDVYLRDETSAEKGGVDQSVELSATFGTEKMFVKEIDDRLMRAFAFAYKKLERNLQEFHRKRVDFSQGKEGRINKLLKRFGLRR
ncbi:MAG: HPF/RaiA family ribosome-associated protein [Patescibacteria group bacterium]|jgi:ribosomal subunit interface protein